MIPSPQPGLPDHRVLGRRLEIFATEEQCGAGLPFWLPAGAAVRGELERYVRDLERRHGYAHVNTPALARRELYERSGHWDHYHDDMYPPIDLGSEQLVLRPMLCPHHILIYGRRPRTLRELPVRLAEVGPMFRYERSGVVGGLSRVRQMTLNDGHVFCAPEQVAAEIAEILAMVHEAYAALHIPPPRPRLSRGGGGAKYAAGVAWAQAEGILRDALRDSGLAHDEAEDEAAFYGPKIDLQVTDPQGREESLSTIQVDLHLPERFDLHYERAGVAHRPVIVHRSIVSTMERMVAHLLEVHDGALPLWLSPVHALVLPATDAARPYAREVAERLRAQGLRIELDERDRSLASRVRDAAPRHLPFLAVAGEREAAHDEIAVRARGGAQLGPIAVDAFARLIADGIRARVKDATEPR